MPTFASDTRSLCCFLSLLLQLKCTVGIMRVGLNYVYVTWKYGLEQEPKEMMSISCRRLLHTTTIYHHYIILSTYQKIKMSSFGGGPTKLFTRVIAILRSPSCPHWTGTTQIASSNGSHSPCLTLFCPTSHACSPSLSFCFPTVYQNIFFFFSNNQNIS